MTNLPWTNYTLKEVKAPAGYTLSTDQRTFTIGSGKLSADSGIFINAKNAVLTPSKPGKVLADSGANPATLPLAGAAVALAGLGGLLVARARRRSN